MTLALCSQSVPYSLLMRLTDARLVDLALGALEEVAATCRYRQAERSWALRLALAYLASRSRSDRAPYDCFWRAVRHARPRERSAGVNAALNAIYRRADRRRDIEIISLYEERARKAHSTANSEHI